MADEKRPLENDNVPMEDRVEPPDDTDGDEDVDSDDEDTDDDLDSDGEPIWDDD